MATTVVFGGGPGSPVGVTRVLGGVSPARVIAADSGLVGCTEAGLIADVVIGDMDSVPAALLEQAAARGARLEVRPREKDATDLELALDLALELSTGVSQGVTGSGEPEQVLVFGSDGGRLDHLVASMVLLGAPQYAAMEIEAWLGSTRVVPVHGRRLVDAEPGVMVSLLALHGPASAVTTSGLHWGLDGEELHAGSSRGVSNRFVGRRAYIEVGGPRAVTVVIPDRKDASADPDEPRTSHERGTDMTQEPR